MMMRQSSEKCKLLSFTFNTNRHSIRSHFFLNLNRVGAVGCVCVSNPGAVTANPHEQRTHK